MANLTRRQAWIRATIIFALTVVAYLPALNAGFVWDDDDHVTGNETLQDASGLRRLWVERGAVPQYYPLVHTTFWIERQLWGLNPVAYHATNIALHALAAVLLWAVLVRLRVPYGFLAALIFALHPVGVESVAWITERKNVLSAVFYLASALAWLRTQAFAPSDEGLATIAGQRSAKDATHRSTGVPLVERARWWYTISLALFVCAMLSKTVACSLPAAMLLVVWWKKGRVQWGDVRPLVPFFVIGLALAVNTALMERTRVGAVGNDWSFGPAERLLIAGRAVWFYAMKLLWPANLTFIYPRWEINAGSWMQWLFPLGAAALVSTAWASRHRIGRGPVVALLFFGITLVPALGFVNVYPMRFSFVADHFQYLAMIGPIALVAAVIARYGVAERAAFVLPLLLGVLTWRQTGVYRNLETLWTDTIAKNPSAWLAHNNLGNVLLDRGDLQGAIVRYRKAAALKADYYEAHGNLGSALLRIGAVDEARGSTDAALRVAPGYTPALVTRAAILSRDGHPSEAVSVLQQVLRQEPGNGEALNTLGSVLASAGDIENAGKAFEAALQMRPELVQARVNLARILLQTARFGDASAQIEKALHDSPGDADALIVKGIIVAAREGIDTGVNYFRDLARQLPADASVRFHLGTLLSQSGRTSEAIPEFLATIRLNPQHAEARNNLGIAYLISGQYENAVVQFEHALDLKRNNPEAHNNLAYALIRLGRTEDAVRNLRAALALRPGYMEARAQLRTLGKQP
ncbi:MAG TPA: tetratricopeptide repeat protein [Gemmatimonadaceae bacterium]|nr:tetratricopeptide repeat protein [Gemmatimonadaceae bacterium]